MATSGEQCRSELKTDQNLRCLLDAWGLRHLLPFLQAQCIDLGVLLLMQLKHVTSLLRGHPLGVQVRFEHELRQWRLQQNRPLCDCENRNAGNIIISSATGQTRIESYDDDAYCILDDIGDETTNASSPARRDSIDYMRADAVHDLKPNDDNNITMRQILERCPSRGQKLLKHASINKSLDKRKRTELIAIIAKYFCIRKLPLSKKVCKRLEREILEIFPRECTKHYYTPCGSSRIIQRMYYTRYHMLPQEEYAKVSGGERRIQLKSPRHFAWEA